jgi:hypothetical protein
VANPALLERMPASPEQNQFVRPDHLKLVRVSLADDFDEPLPEQFLLAGRAMRRLLVALDEASRGGAAPLSFL